MLKKRIKYEDFDGVEREEDFYFNLTKSELVKMQLGTTGGMEKLIQTIIEKKDAPQIMNVFEEIILKSYGEKSPDGRRFIKSAQLSEEFAQTNAYDILFMELANDADAATNFINGLVPNIPEVGTGNRVVPING